MQTRQFDWRRPVLAAMLAWALPASQAASDPLAALPKPLAEAVDALNPGRVANAIVTSVPNNPMYIAQSAASVASAAERASNAGVSQQRVDAAIGGAFYACVQNMAVGLSPCKEVHNKTIDLLIPKGDLARFDPPLMNLVYPAVLAEAERRNDSTILKAASAALVAAINTPTGPAMESYVPAATAVVARGRQLPGRERLEYCVRLMELIQAQRQRNFQPVFVSVPADLLNIATQRDVFMADPATALAVITSLFQLSRQPNFATMPGSLRARMEQVLKLNMTYLETARPGTRDELWASFNAEPAQSR